MTSGRRSRRAALAALLAFALIGAACGGDDDDASGSGEGGDNAIDASAEDVRAVPDEYDTIQAAVDAAAEGDLVLVSPGTYKEAVTVTTADITIRGLDRNDVILDGEFEKDNGIRVLETDGVVIENMTAKNYTANGFFWTGVDRYRGSYLTAINNGDYGIYAFDSTTGTLEHSLGSGSPDAGFYIGQCYPCDALIDDVIGENNGLGYSGTNSGGNLLIVNSVFRNNRAGIVPNSGDYEKFPPERESTLVGNLVYDNSNADTPAIDSARQATGNGILIFGGIDNVVERNRVEGHDVVGIALVTAFDVGTWPVTGNQVRDNVVSGSGVADLAVVGRPRLGQLLRRQRVRDHGPARARDAPAVRGRGVGRPRGRRPRPGGRWPSSTPSPSRRTTRRCPSPSRRTRCPTPTPPSWAPAAAPREVDLDAIEVPAAPQ